jgi:hypothetical protein
MSDEPEVSEPLSEFIGLIVGWTTRTVYAVINPRSDHELDNPRHLLLQNDKHEPVRMVKVARGKYEESMSMDDVNALISAWYVETSEVYRGPEYIEGAV